MDKKPLISYVILTWNSEKYITKCIDSIFSITSIPAEIIVIDNGSQDGTPELLKQLSEIHPELTAVLLEKNYGTTISRNIGISGADPESKYICILDSDTIINETAIQSMIDILEDDERNMLCGPVMYDLEGVLQVTAKKIPTAIIKLCKGIPIKKLQSKGLEMERYNFTDNASYHPVGYLISACWLIKHEAFEHVGMLDEKIFYSPEDVEFCVRLWNNGYRVLYSSNGSIIHAVQRISKKKLLSKHNWEHLKGLIYFFHKYHLFISSENIVCE